MTDELKLERADAVAEVAGPLSPAAERAMLIGGAAAGLLAGLAGLSVAGILGSLATVGSAVSATADGWATQALSIAAPVGTLIGAAIMALAAVARGSRPPAPAPQPLAGLGPFVAAGLFAVGAVSIYLIFGLSMATIVPIVLAAVAAALALDSRIAPASGTTIFTAIRSVLSIVAAAAPVAWVLDVTQPTLGWSLRSLHTEQLLAFELGLVIGLIFLTWNIRGRRVGRPRLYDTVLAAIGLVTAFYVAFNYPVLLNTFGLTSPASMAKILISAILIVLCVEGVRRSLGIALAIVVLLFLAYAFWGYLLPWDSAPSQPRWERVVLYHGLDTNALFGAALKIGVVVIVPFVLLGKMLSAAGGSDFFANLAMAAMGRFRGGAGKIAVVGSSLFGMISGSAVANVAAVGVVTIPLMKRSGFQAPVAGGVEAAGSTGGQLMPPVMGAAAFLMADILEVEYSTVMLAAIIPIVLYYLAIFIMVDLYAASRGIAGIPRKDIPPLWPELKQGWHFILPFVVFIVGMLAFNMEPETASLFATATLLVTVTVFGYHGRRLTFRKFLQAVVESGEAAAEIVIVTAAAGIVIGALNFTGTVFTIGADLTALAGGNVVVLLIIAAIASVILGMGMPTVSVYLLLAFLIAPALVNAGVQPMAAHMFIQYFGLMSMVTPPVAVASFAAATIARASPWTTSWAAMWLGWTAYIVPFIFVFAPQMLLGQDWNWGLLVGLTTLIGIAFVSFGAMGFARTRLSPLMRVLSVVAGLALMVPERTFPGSTTIVIGGAILALVLAVKIFILDRRSEARRSAGSSSMQVKEPVPGQPLAE